MLAKLFPHWLALAHKIGNTDGGALLDQSVFTNPAFVCWNDTDPTLTGASAGFPCSTVDHASVNELPLASFTVTFSRVGVVL